MQDDGAVVSINAQQPHARELIEAGLPRLREMFEASGTGLLDVNIEANGQHSADDGHAEQSQSATASTDASAPVDAEAQPLPAHAAPGSEHRLDLWA